MNILRVKILKFAFLVILFSIYGISIQSAKAYEPCRIKGYAYSIECESVQAGGNQASLGSFKIFRIPALVRYPLPEPIIWIPNGLALDANTIAPNKLSLLRRVRNHQDFLWLEVDALTGNDLRSCQNGNSKANHSTKTKKKIENRIDLFSDEQLLNRCQSTLLNTGLSAFSPSRVAQYYESMRLHLGLKQVVVFAEGRGAEVALAWQKLAPDAIKFQVFDSPVVIKGDAIMNSAIQLELLLQHVYNACEKNISCDTNYPNSQQSFKKIISTLPVIVTVNDPLTGSAVSIAMTKSLFYKGVSQILQSSATASQVPKLFAQIVNGQWQPFVGLLSLNWSKRESKVNHAAYLAQTCMAFRGEKQTNNQSWFTQTLTKRVERLCNGLPIYDIDSLIVQDNPVATLTFKGGLQFKQLQDMPMLTQQTVVRVPNITGGALRYGCAKDVMYRYFKWQRKTPNNRIMDDKQLRAECLLQIPFPSMKVIR